MKVTAAYGTPTGSVKFSDGAAVLGNVALNAGGVATLTASDLPAGQHSITAEYSGDGSYLGSVVSANVDTSVETPPPSSASHFSISASPPALTLRANEQGRVALTFNPSAGFTGTVALSCSGLPEWEECSFSPRTLTADGSDKPQVAELTFSGRTVASSGAGRAGPKGIAATQLVGLLMLPGLALGGASRFLRGRAERLRKTLSIICMVAVIGTIGGCGSDSHSDTGGTHNVGTFMVTVSATASQTAADYAGPATRSINISVAMVE